MSRARPSTSSSPAIPIRRSSRQAPRSHRRASLPILRRSFRRAPTARRSSWSIHGQRRHGERRRGHLGLADVHDLDHPREHPAGAGGPPNRITYTRRATPNSTSRRASSPPGVFDARAYRQGATDRHRRSERALSGRGGRRHDHGERRQLLDRPWRRSFTYVPAAGVTGADTFTYQVTDDAGDVTRTGTINITVGQRVWYSVTSSTPKRGGRRRPIDQRLRQHRGRRATRRFVRERLHLRLLRRWREHRPERRDRPQVRAAPAGRARRAHRRHPLGHVQWHRGAHQRKPGDGGSGESALHRRPRDTGGRHRPRRGGR